MWENRKELIAKIEHKRGSRLISYLTSDRQNATAIIAKDALPVFFNQLRGLGPLTKLDVLVFTNGGDTLAAFGLGRLVREFAPKWVGALIPDICYSAGTLFALCANEIYMSRAGTLSPIDPSVTTPLNPVPEGMLPGQRQLVAVSVESVAGFKSLIKDDWGITNEQMLTSVFKILAEKVHPLALGDVYRSRQQIERLAHQLLIVHRKDKAKIKSIISALTKEFGSHDYPISRTEARKLMGNQIAAEDAEVEDLLVKLFNDYSKEMELHVPFNPAAALAKEKAAGKTPPVRVRLIPGIIETSTSRDVFEQEMLLSEVLAPGPAGPIKALQQEMVEAGWKHYA
jgi:ClpP class serine protease